LFHLSSKQLRKFSLEWLERTWKISKKKNQIKTLLSGFDHQVQFLALWLLGLYGPEDKEYISIKAYPSFSHSLNNLVLDTHGNVD